MRDRNIGWILVIAVVVALLVAALCYCSGCALLTKHTADIPRPAGATPAGSDTPRSDPPRAAAGVAQPSSADQQGGVNTAVQGVTGVAFTRNEAMPLGLATLLAFVTLLSHRREVMRIRQNGKGGSERVPSVRPLGPAPPMPPERGRGTPLHGVNPKPITEPPEGFRPAETAQEDVCD